MKAILETEDLVKYYGEGENQVRAIDHTSMQVQHGEFVAVVGRSGSGKSTLLHMLERFCLGYSEKYRNGRTSSCYAESTIRRTEAACGYRTRPCSPSGNYFG